jgi:hypothetical protein
MANSYTYSPQNVRLVIGGYIFTGWNNITITRPKSFLVVKGIRGKHTRVQNPDTSATIVISLMQTSPGNDVFSETLRQDIINGTARIALTLVDKSGSSVFSSNDAYVTGFPSATFSGQFQDRPWELFAQSTTDYNVGGNGQPGNSLATIVSEAVGNLF